MHRSNGRRASVYLSRESFDKNSHEQVEQHIVAERHQSDEVQGCPCARLLHAIVENLVPVFLRQHLDTRNDNNSQCAHGMCRARRSARATSTTTRTARGRRLVRHGEDTCPCDRRKPCRSNREKRRQRANILGDTAIGGGEATRSIPERRSSRRNSIGRSSSSPVCTARARRPSGCAAVRARDTSSNGI
jgi:hypothetical protein